MKKLDQYKGKLTPSQIAELMNAAGRNAKRLVDDANLEFPEQKEITLAAAKADTLSKLLSRIAAVEELRRLLETNVTESLALEVSLIKAFGAPQV